MSQKPSPLLIGVSARIYYPEGPVLSLGGVLSINSTIGEGTVVSIQVPVDPVEQEGAE